MRTRIRTQNALALATTALSCLCLTQARADYSSTVLSFNPAGYWRLNETTPVPIADQAVNSGSAGASVIGYYRGTAGVNFTHPTLPDALTGSSDGAATISGNTAGGVASSGYLLVPYAPLLNTPTFTAEAWLNPTDIDGTLASPTHCAFSCGDFASPRAGWLIYQSGEGWNLRMYNRNGTTTSLSISGGGAPTAGTWYHVAVAFDGTTASLYINGVQVSSGNPSSYVPGSSGGLAVGERADGFYGWNGVADEVAFYTNALSAAVIAAHYSAAATNGTGYAAQILADRPVAYYRLNEPTYTAPDPSTLPVAANIGTLGATANGTKYPGLTAGVAGPAYSGLGAGNYACQFDGIESYVSLGNPAELNFAGQITMMAWVKPTATDGTRNILCHGHQTSPNNAELGLRINAGSYEVWSWGVGNNPGVYGKTIPPEDIGNWVFLAGTYDGTTWHLYRDGVELGSTTDPTGAIVVSDTAWAIGARGTGTERFFKGGIDEVAIFTNALSAAQIVQIYNAANVPPTITQQPLAPTNTVYEGMTVSFQVTAVGNLPLAYRWTKNGTNLVGMTATNLVLANVKTNDSGNYAVVVTNTVGATTSSVAAITVQFGPPVIFQQPQSISRFPGGTATFSVVAGGSVPISYQWTNNAGLIAGATNTSYTFTGVKPSDAGNYGVRLTNPYGTTYSTATTLTILPVTNYAAVVMDGKPVAYWRLNETSGTVAADYAGGYNSTNVGGVTVGQPGPVPPAFPGFEAGNLAIQFPATTTSSSSPGVSLLNNVTNFTLCGWINPTAIQQGGFFGQNDVVEFRFLNTTTIELWTPYGSIDYVVGTADNLTVGNWNFVVASATANTLNLYINGQLVASAGTTATSGYGSSASPFLLSGNTSGNADPSLNGLMDEVVVYNRTLSALEIGNLYYNGTNTPSAPVFVQQPQSITRYAGGTAVFTAQVGGYVPLTFQWQHAGTNLPGASSATLVLPNVSSANAGSYVLAVTNPVGNASSTPATLTVLTPPGAYAAAVMAGGPLAYWRLDETGGSLVAVDNAGGYNGTYQNVTLGTTGALNGDPDTAGTFDGSSSAVLIGNPAGLNFAGQITMMAWVKPSATDGLRNIFEHGYQTSPNNAEVGLRVNAGQYQVVAWNGTDHSVSIAIPPGDIGNWVQLVGTYDGTTWRLYRNGVQAATRTDTVGALIVSSTGWAIGARGTGGERFFSGDLDEVGLFNKALSADQVNALYLIGRYGTTTPPLFIQEPAPAPQTVVAGSTATFVAVAGGSYPLGYQWQKNGVNIPGATLATLTISNAYFTDAGNYTLVVTNNLGSTNSTVATLTVMPPPSYANATNGLVLHLKFDGNFTDSSGLGHNAIPSPTPPGFVPGQLGNAIQCSTVASSSSYTYAQVYDTTTYTPWADLQFSSNVNFSVAYWVKFTGAPGDLPFIATAQNSYGGAGLTFAPGYNTGTWSYYLGAATGTGSSLGTGYSTQSINNGQWHSLVHTFDRTGNATTYLDGVQVNVGSMIGVGDLDTINFLTIGQDPTTFYAETATLQIDDVGIWRRALTSYEAMGVYAGAQQGASFDVIAPVKVYVSSTGGYVDVAWQAGTLVQSTNVNGIYTPVSGATPPFYRTSPTNSAMFFRVRN